MEQRNPDPASTRSIHLGLSRDEWREFQECVRRHGETVDAFFTEKALELIASERESDGRPLN